MGTASPSSTRARPNKHEREQQASATEIKDKPQSPKVRDPSEHLRGSVCVHRARDRGWLAPSSEAQRQSAASRGVVRDRVGDPGGDLGVLPVRRPVVESAPFRGHHANHRLGRRARLRGDLLTSRPGKAVQQRLPLRRHVHLVQQDVPQGRPAAGTGASNRPAIPAGPHTVPRRRRMLLVRLRRSCGGPCGPRVPKTAPSRTQGARTLLGMQSMIRALVAVALLASSACATTGAGALEDRRAARDQRDAGALVALGGAAAFGAGVAVAASGAIPPPQPVTSNESARVVLLVATPIAATGVLAFALGGLAFGAGAAAVE
jgi:hypothetical protein